MRLIRLAFDVVLAIVLIGIALANRGVVTLNMFPAQMGTYQGVDWALRMPLFLIIFLAIAFGMVMGLIWEWLRESGLRAEAARKANELARLEREMGHLQKRQVVAPKDEVLAILDAPKAPALPKT
ncbi:MAG: LapA family protein [Paracoccus sp. (in: a-proteobacteria)]|nr:LapA family protein [Paracoccus sp. (in: a-proteobacteria)]